MVILIIVSHNLPFHEMVVPGPLDLELLSSSLGDPYVRGMQHILRQLEILNSSEYIT